MRTKQFKTIEQPRKKSSQAAEQIIDAIRSGRYVGGDRLPPERELACAMGVSRSSIREAIGALQVAGILQSRVGDGTYVASAAAGKVNRGVASLLEAGVHLLEIWKAKEELETMLLELATLEATEEELEGLEAILDGMTEGVRARDYRKYLVTNVRFHLAIARAAKNAPLEKAENSLLRVTQQIYRAAERGSRQAVAGHLDRALAVHEGILDVIARRDPGRARRAMKRHFEEVASFLEGAFG